MSLEPVTKREPAKEGMKAVGQKRAYGATYHEIGMICPVGRKEQERCIYVTQGQSDIISWYLTPTIPQFDS